MKYEQVESIYNYSLAKLIWDSTKMACHLNRIAGTGLL